MLEKSLIKEIIKNSKLKDCHSVAKRDDSWDTKFCFTSIFKDSEHGICDDMESIQLYYMLFIILFLLIQPFPSTQPVFELIMIDKRHKLCFSPG